MDLTLQIVLSGLAAGSVYGLLAVGYTFVYRLTGIVHFALGDLVGLGVFVALFVTAGRGAVTQDSATSWRFAVGILVALAVVVALGTWSYFGLIQQHIARGSTVGWVAATVAIAFAVQSLLNVVFTRPAYVFPDPIPFHDAGSEGIVTVAGATFQLRSLFVIGLGIVLAAIATYVTRRTRFGRGLQAIAEDVDGAQMIGVPFDRYVGLAFGLVGALAVVIAVAAAPSGPFSVTSGTLYGLKGLVAALLVGFTAPGWAFVAGLGLGFVESLIASGRISGRGLGPSYREILPLVFVFLLLVLRGRVRSPELE